jgi:hypothetical protein
MERIAEIGGSFTLAEMSTMSLPGCGVGVRRTPYTLAKDTRGQALHGVVSVASHLMRQGYRRSPNLRSEF